MGGTVVGKGLFIPRQAHLYLVDCHFNRFIDYNVSVRFYLIIHCVCASISFCWNVCGIYVILCRIGNRVSYDIGSLNKFLILTIINQIFLLLDYSRFLSQLSYTKGIFLFFILKNNLGIPILTVILFNRNRYICITNSPRFQI